MTARKASPRSGMRIAVVSYGTDTIKTSLPGGDAFSRCSLDRELSLTRPALLYGDQVTLCSTAYSLNSMLSQGLGVMDTQPHRFLEMMESFCPAIKSSPEWTELYDIKRQFERSLSPKARADNLKKMRAFTAEITTLSHSSHSSIIDSSIDTEGLAELNLAKATGILEIDEAPGINAKSLGSMMSDLTSSLTIFMTHQANSDVQPQAPQLLANATASLIRYLVAVLNTPNAYPILDDSARQIVTGPVLQQIDDTARSRANHAGTAGYILGQLPLFNVPLVEVEEIRHTLSDHLGAFREAVSHLASNVRTTQWEPGFDLEVQNLYLTQIEPQIRDLRAKLDDISSRDNTVRRRRSSAISAGKTAGALFLGMNAATTLIQDWLRSSLTLAASLPASLAAFTCAMIHDLEAKVNAEHQKLGENKLYYYIRAEGSLHNINDPARPSN